MALEKEFYIDFDTTEMPGRLVAVKITIERVIINDMDKKMNIALCDHPLYARLKRYVNANDK